MNVEDEMELCSQHYKKWKSMALSANNPEEAKKYLDRAFFWLELQTAYIVLFSLEQLKSRDKSVNKRIIEAKAHLTKKLADYADEVMKELNL